MLTTKTSRPLQLFTRFMQWTSAVIVMGITSYFIHRGPHSTHLIYQEVIAVLSVVFFLPAFASPFVPNSLSKFVLAIDIVFSYLWLTAFIFAAEDYNRKACYVNSPPGFSCNKKYANEAFIFLAFIFTFFGMFLKVAGLWAYRKERSRATRAGIAHEKRGSTDPLDAPAPPAGTV
ncbi:Uncharacterized protein PECH_000750 [Penicillium ucsense]|uniref:MARVEL domain-containing protein n=1 Tax=Penicillium ucsense TaxID=2839758 RepID=A0A8J8WG62_9EURO|nr:Uncharacterized protein PECM_000393 [Penicillium ucsense]KAF7733418.1 Uncharacterized protein PECH_000750 [Penicillium ucsense]